MPVLPPVFAIILLFIKTAFRFHTEPHKQRTKGAPTFSPIFSVTTTRFIASLAMTLLLWLASSTGAVADDYPVNPGDCQDSWVCIFSPTIGGTITGPYSLCPGKTGSWSISDTVTPGRKERCEMPKYPGVLNANGDKGKIDWVWKIEGVNSFTADGVGSSFDKSYSEPGEYKITWKGSAYTDDKGESEKCDNPYDVEVTFSFTVNSSTPTAALTSIVIKSDLVCAEESDGISIIGDQSQCDPGSYTVKWKIESDGGSQNLQFTPSSGEVSLTFMQSANITFKVKAGAGAKAGTAQIKITATVNGVDQTMSGAVTVNDPKPKANLSSIFTMPDSISMKRAMESASSATVHSAIRVHTR
jgi:hypothetical protein